MFGEICRKVEMSWVPEYHQWDDPSSYGQNYDRGMELPMGGVNPADFMDAYAYQDFLAAQRMMRSELEWVQSQSYDTYRETYDDFLGDDLCEITASFPLEVAPTEQDDGVDEAERELFDEFARRAVSVKVGQASLMGTVLLLEAVRKELGQVIRTSDISGKVSDRRLLHFSNELAEAHIRHLYEKLSPNAPLGRVQYKDIARTAINVEVLRKEDGIGTRLRASERNYVVRLLLDGYEEAVDKVGAHHSTLPDEFYSDASLEEFVAYDLCGDAIFAGRLMMAGSIDSLQAIRTKTVEAIMADDTASRIGHGRLAGLQHLLVGSQVRIMQAGVADSNDDYPLFALSLPIAKYVLSEATMFRRLREEVFGGIRASHIVEGSIETIFESERKGKLRLVKKAFDLA
jgi:hypothetical protein